MEHVGEHPRQHAQGHQHGQAGAQRQPPIGKEEVGQQHQVQPGQGNRPDQADRQQAAAGIQQAHQVAGALAVAADPGVHHHAQDGAGDQRVHQQRGQVAVHEPVDRESGDHHGRGHAQQGDQFQADVAVLGCHPGQGSAPGGARIGDFVVFPDASLVPGIRLRVDPVKKSLPARRQPL